MIDILILHFKMAYPVVDIKSENFEDELCKAYDEYGVCVITNVVDDARCDAIMDNIVGNFEKLGSGIDRHKPETWNDYNLPVMTRAGMFQATMCNLPVIWETKIDKNIVKIFEILYGKFRGSTDMIVSNDGINIKHGAHGPFHDESKSFEKDWAHIDQTTTDNPFQCIQGQLVMTNTTSAFRCTPKSHKYLGDILRKYNMLGHHGNWLKFRLEQKEEVREYLKEKGVTVWQPAIYAPKGSFIVWSSATIHSAKFADGPTDYTPDDPWKGWRGVLYISYSLRQDMKKEDIDKKVKTIEENRVLNHWGTKMFNLYTGGAYTQRIKRHPRIKHIIERPKMVYKYLGIDINQVTKNENILKFIT